MIVGLCVQDEVRGRGVAEVGEDGIVIDLRCLNVSLVSVTTGGECMARSLAKK